MMRGNDRLAVRKAAADKYDSEWPLRTTMGNLSREGFLAGWDAAMERYYSLEQIQALAWEYCNDATSAARLEDRLRLSLFVQWLAKREREGLG